MPATTGFRPPPQPHDLLAARRGAAPRRDAARAPRATARTRSRSPITATSSASSSSRKRRAKHGVQPIIGIEAYVAPGLALRQEPAARRAARQEALPPPDPPRGELRRLQEPDPALDRGLPRGVLLPAAHRQGDPARSTAKGSSACRRASRARSPRCFAADRVRRRRRGRSGVPRPVRPRSATGSSCRTTGCEEQELVNEGSVDLRASSGIGLVATNDCHYLLPDDHVAHDVLVCIQTGQERPRPRPDALLAAALPQVGQEMARAVRRGRRRRSRTPRPIAERCNFAFEKQPNHLPEFPVPDGYDLDGLLREGRARRIRARLPTWRAAADAGTLPARSRRPTAKRLDREIAIIRRDGLRRLLPHRVGLHPLRPRERDPGGSRAAARRPARSSRTACGSPTSIPMRVRPAVRALPESRAGHDARHRHRLLLPQPRAGHRLRDRRSTGVPTSPRSSRSGRWRRARCIRDVGRGLEIPYAEVDRIAKLVPQQPGVEVTIEKSLAEVPALKQAYESDPRVKQLIDVATPARRARAPRLDPRRGRRDRPAADRRVRAALPGDERRNHDAVRQGRHRGHRPAQDGLPRA